jgi:hypothetical protein
VADDLGFILIVERPVEDPQVPLTRPSWLKVDHPYITALIYHRKMFQSCRSATLSKR